MPEKIPHYRFVAIGHERVKPGQPILIRLPEEVPAGGESRVQTKPPFVITTVVAANDEHARRRIKSFTRDIADWEWEDGL